jgi:hypothetical protein
VSLHRGDIQRAVKRIRAAATLDEAMDEAIQLLVKRAMGKGKDMNFDKVPTRSRVSVFNHEKACGFSVRWSEAGTGFGEATFAVDKATGEIRGDLEEMSPQWIGEMLMRLVGTLVTDIETEEPHGIVINDPAIVEKVKQLAEQVRKKPN